MTNSLKILDDYLFYLGFWGDAHGLAFMYDRYRNECPVDSQGRERPEGDGTEQAAAGFGHSGLG